MKQSIYIKNMVCDRCLTTVRRVFDELGIKVDSIKLGIVVIHKNTINDLKQLSSSLQRHGFEIITDDSDLLVEQIKLLFLDRINSKEEINLSVLLPEVFYKSYTHLSKMFSKNAGITLEKYLIHLKVEKAKELIQSGRLNFTEIAYELDYKTSSHLSRQFREVVGMTMSEYKTQQNWQRRSLDQII